MRKSEIKFPSPVHKFSGPVSHYADGRMQQAGDVLVSYGEVLTQCRGGAEDTLFSSAALKHPPSQRS